MRITSTRPHKFRVREVAFWDSRYGVKVRSGVKVRVVVRVNVSLRVTVWLCVQRLDSTFQVMFRVKIRFRVRFRLALGLGPGLRIDEGTGGTRVSDNVEIEDGVEVRRCKC